MSMIAAPLEHLDLATVLKVSQAVSGEMALDKLLDTLMRTAVEYAGAERAVLMLAREAGPRIAAEATAGSERVAVRLCDEPVTGALLAETILRHVLRARENVILDDASAPNPFSSDPYIARRQPRSVFCLPLMNQAKLIGVLYLENNVAAGAFAPARTAVLKLLASQAAISIENGRLYRNLAEREARIRRLFDANIIGIFMWDFDGGTLDANDVFLRMIGYDREDLAALRIRWTDMTPPEWRERTAEMTRELKLHGQAGPFEKEYFRKDGSRVPVLLGGATFEPGGNEGVAFVLDLTERKRAEERYEQAIAAAEAGFWEWDVPKDEFFVSPKLLEMTDFAPGTRFAGRADFMARAPFHPDDRMQWERAVKELFASGGTRRVMEIRTIHGDETHWALLSGMCVRDAAGKILRWTGSATDITARKLAEQALREAQGALARANRATTLGMLGASIVHEVNQPLGAIAASAAAGSRWLSAQPPDLDKAQRALERIVNDSRRASAVVGRLRALVKRQAPRRDRVDLNEAIREVLALTQDEVRRNDILVATSLAADLPVVEGDRIQIQQVVLNLVVNAIEAMSALDGRRRQLTLGSAREDANAVRVEVRDSGPGVDPSHAERLFEAFYTTKADGMGMGLAISCAIIEAHGGRLWVGPNGSHGAAFCFSLPVLAAT